MFIILMIIVIALLLAAAFVAFIHFSTSNRLVREFRSVNVIVYGKKRKGKDLLFQHIINRRKTKYAANINYGGKFKRIKTSQVSVAPNTYVNFINGKVSIIDKKAFSKSIGVNLEGVDVYLSDGGVILPSQMDSVLHKTFPSLPITYALTGHLYNNNIHINTQNLERVWKAVREQADYFVRIRKRWIIGGIFVIFTTEYDNYNSAFLNLRPLKKRMLNQFSSAEYDKFNATYGFIKDGFVIIRKKDLHYDTRAYHKIIFGKKAPKAYKKK